MTTAVALLVVSAICVALTVVTSALVPAAAVLAVVLGAAASRIVYGEVLRTRSDAGRLGAQQARAFQEATAASSRDHAAFRDLMTGRLLERDLAVSRLSSAVRSAERRAAEAETGEKQAASRARQEALRADETRRQLGRLLDEVFGTALVDEGADRGLSLVRSIPASAPHGASAEASSVQRAG